jgi:excisionase family DNA binding protein
VQKHTAEVANVVKLWTVEAVAEFLGVSKTWVYRRVESGEIPHRKIGRVVRFVPDEVTSWLNRQSVGGEALAVAGQV